MCAGRSSNSADSRRAHGGPLAAISAQGQRVWTSGGLKQHPTLRLWSQKGEARFSAPLDDMGMFPSCASSTLQLMPYSGLGHSHMAVKCT